MHKRLGKIVFPLFFIITLIDHSLQLYAFVKKDCMFVASSFSSSEAWLYFLIKNAPFIIVILFYYFFHFTCLNFLKFVSSVTTRNALMT